MIHIRSADELLDDGGEVVEGKSELVPRRYRAVAEAWAVRGEHAVAVGWPVLGYGTSATWSGSRAAKATPARPVLAVEDI